MLLRLTKSLIIIIIRCMRKTISINKSKKPRLSKFGFGLNTKALFKDGSTVVLRHESETYYLRLTKNNKVILTK